jgi:S-adenosylmethionine-diacylglycerol 3-amino-3-carboxypropyl transferase
MTDPQLQALWDEVTRTARPGAHVVFRTAAEPTLLPAVTTPAPFGAGTYEAERSRR